MTGENASKPLLRIVLKRLSIAGIISCATLLFFFWIGNFQQFLDSSLLMILGILGWAAPLTGLLSLTGFIVALVSPRPGETRKKRIPALIGFALSVLFCVSLFLLSYFLMAVLGRS